MAIVERSTHLNAAPEAVANAIRYSRTLRFVTRGLLAFRPTRGEAFPEQWTAGSYRVQLYLFHVVPLGWQDIRIELPGPGDQWVVRDNGRGLLARRWDHRIFVQAESGGTRYTDQVFLEAGLLTLPVALFARVLYAYRQWRWRRLAAHLHADPGAS